MPLTPCARAPVAWDNLGLQVAPVACPRSHARQRRVDLASLPNRPPLPPHASASPGVPGGGTSRRSGPFPAAPLISLSRRSPTASLKSDITPTRTLISDITQGMKKRVLVQVEEDTHAKWKSEADRRGMSMSEIARRLIENFLNKEGPKNG